MAGRGGRGGGACRRAATRALRGKPRQRARWHAAREGHARSYFFSNSPVRWRLTNVVLPAKHGSQASAQEAQRASARVARAAAAPTAQPPLRIPASERGASGSWRSSRRSAVRAAAAACGAASRRERRSDGNLRRFGARRCAATRARTRSAVADEHQLEGGHACGRAQAAARQRRHARYQDKQASQGAKRPRRQHAPSGTFMPGSAMTTRTTTRTHRPGAARCRVAGRENESAVHCRRALRRLLQRLRCRSSLLRAAPPRAAPQRRRLPVVPHGRT